MAITINVNGVDRAVDVDQFAVTPEHAEKFAEVLICHWLPPPRLVAAAQCMI